MEPGAARDGGGGRGLPRRAFLERAAARVAVVKPQSAFFEALGWRGVRCSRGSSRARAEARPPGRPRREARRHRLDGGGLRRRVPGARGAVLRADALTVNPYLGLDALEPVRARGRATRAPGSSCSRARATRAGATSRTCPTSPGAPLYERVGRGARARSEARSLGAETGFSGLGLVAGRRARGGAAPARARADRALPRAGLRRPGRERAGVPSRRFVRGTERPPRGRPRERRRGRSSFPTAPDDETPRAWEQRRRRRPRPRSASSAIPSRDADRACGRASLAAGVALARAASA